MGAALLGPQSAVPFYLRLACIFLHHILKNKAKLSVSSAWWPLNRGQNDRTLTRMPKRWQRPLDGGQGCALRKISGSPSGSQAFYLSRPGLKVGRPAKNFGEPFGLPSIPAGVPRPLKLVARVHVMRKYFVRTRILLACRSPNSVILAFGFDQNPHVLLWNPSKFSCHSDLKPETSNDAELFRF